MKIEIKSWYTASVLFEGDFSSLAEAVLAAIKAKANLRYANLRYADLSSADLSSADLSSADLRYANLRYANLRSADLSSADLSSADLISADLSYANLRYANLRYANLRSADLSSANLRSADLSYANLSYANLRYADLSYANLRSADLSSAKNADYAVAVTRILPDGDIIGWKKLAGGLVAKLLIPSEAKRSHAFGRKCRAEYAKVLEIWNGKNEHTGEAHAMRDATFAYEAGKKVKPTTEFDADFTNECSTGIHFFITRLEAEQYEG